MDLEELFESSDRSVHAALDVALGRTFRALAEHEQSILVTLHAGLFGPDRSIVEIITKGIPVSVALAKIVNRRNELAHQIIQPTDDMAREFSLFKATSQTMMSEVSVDSLDHLRKRARESSKAMYAVARRMLAIFQDLPAAAPTGHYIGAYARDTGRP